MLNVFTLANGRLFQEEIESLAGAGRRCSRSGSTWRAPTPRRRAGSRERFGVTHPRATSSTTTSRNRPASTKRTTASCTSARDFLIDATTADAEPARNVRVAFILFKNVLFSVHGEDLPVFRLLRLRARRIPALIEDAKDVLLKLYDADAEYSADALEGIYDKPREGQRARAQAGRQRQRRRRGAGGHRQARKT